MVTLLEFPEETRAQRLVLFQEAIAIRFGFIACVQESGNQHQHNQYIHLTGNGLELKKIDVSFTVKKLHKRYTCNCNICK